MNSRIRLAIVAAAGFSLVTCWPDGAIQGQEKKAAKAAAGWTLPEALAQLQLYPNDPYLQYVALQLARREGKLEETAGNVDRMVGRDAFAERRGRRNDVDLFSVFTGALAVQESLQLDTLRGGTSVAEQTWQRRFGPNTPIRADTEIGKNGNADPHAAWLKRRSETVNIADIAGPTIKSHPWVTMLGGKIPEIDPLAKMVPEDFYYVGFKSLNKLLEASEISDLWGKHLFNQTLKDARTQKVGDRLKDQLVVETNPLVKPFYDLVVEEVAVTGSDLFVNEGSDVTVLFRLKQPAVFKARMGSFLVNAEKAHPDAKRTSGEYLGVKYEQLSTPDRQLNVFAAYPAENLHVRSNSKAGFQRVIEAIQAKDSNGKVVRRLGETPEFAYIRTLMQRGAKEEDGFVYLSDPFIRNLIGPKVKLSERRRMLCYNQLRMIGNAALLYRTENGKTADTLETLTRAKCTPGTFNDGDLTCPDGGHYKLSPDGTVGICTHHGHAHFLTPNSEIPATKVHGDEADEYKAFLDDYNQYWRTYFDPIALRLQITPERYRLETIVLPLIDNSIYSGMALALGGKAENLDLLPVPKRNIFTMGMRFNKEELLKHMRSMFPRQAQEELLRGLGVKDQDNIHLDVEGLLSKGIGNQVGLHVYDAPPTFDFNLPMFLGQTTGTFNGNRAGLGSESVLISFLIASLNSPVYMSIPVQDGKIVDEFVAGLDKLFAVEARQKERGWLWSLSKDFYQVPLKGGNGQMARSFSIAFGPVKFRLFWAKIGNGMYIASKLFILEDLLALQNAPKDKSADAKNSEVLAHAMVRIRSQNWNEVLADYRLGWAENNRQACMNNQGPLTSVARAFTPGVGKIDDKELAQISERIHVEADRAHQVHFFCPEGGQYVLGKEGKAVSCSVHGSALAPRQPAGPSEKSSLGKQLDSFSGMTATLTFLEDGLHAVVILDRK